MIKMMAAHKSTNPLELMPAHEPTLLIVPRKMLIEKYLDELGKKAGTPYAKLNCVMLPFWALNKAYHMETGRDLPRDFEQAFMNGGTLLRRLIERGGTPKIRSADELAKAGAVKPGELIMRLQPAKDAEELHKFYLAGDNAIFIDATGKVAIVGKYRDAVKKLDNLKPGERLYLTRHYLTAKETGTKDTLIHASQVAGKTITQTVEEYVKQKTLYQKSIYAIVDLGKVLPDLEDILRLAQKYVKTDAIGKAGRT